MQADTTAAARRPGAPPQFDLRRHYDIMAALDADVHRDAELSAAEARAALTIIGDVPKRMFLPCCGTGRHIRPLLAFGVSKILGVDLSEKCLDKARDDFDQDRRVALYCEDLRAWSADEPCNALIMLGNSFGDLVDLGETRRMVRQMVAQLKGGAAIIMDYIGTGFLRRCEEQSATRWPIRYQGRACTDTRIPWYDPKRRIMTIEVSVTDDLNGQYLWRGHYQKLVLDEGQVRALFRDCGVRIEPVGVATRIPVIRDYYASFRGERGMLGVSTWWRGIKQ